MLYIAQNLRFLRKQKQISQAALAKQIGVVPGTISNYENGASEPDFEHLEMIIKILDVSAHDLLYTNLESERDFKTKGAKILIKENDKDFDKERKLQNSLSNGEGEIFKTKGIENVTLSKGDVKGDKKGDKRKLPKTSPFDEGEVRQSEAFRNATPVIYDMPEMLSVVKEPETPYNENAVCVPVVHIEAAAGGGAFSNYLAIGGSAWSTGLAIGGSAYGHVAIGSEEAKGMYTFVRDLGGTMNGAEVWTIIKQEFPHMWDWVKSVILWAIV